MGRWTLAGLVAVALSAGTSEVAQGQTELITNGGFESGDFTGWTLFSSRPSPDGWKINDGTFLPAGPGFFAGPLAPISGNFDAITNQTGPGTQRLLSNAFVVPAEFSQATLSFSDRLRNWIGAYTEGGQEFRVELFDASRTPIAEIFVTLPGDPTAQLGPNHRVFDVTDLLHTLAGEEASIGFTVEAQAFFFNVSLDDVSLLVVEESPGPSLIVAQIDVKPGSGDNAVNLKHNFSSKGKSSASGGVLPVAVLTTADFDALDADELSIELGDPLLEGTAFPIRASAEDVDSDGDLDLMLHFSIAELVEAGAIDSQSTSLLLSGMTFEGLPFAGADDVRVVQPQ